MATTCLKYSDQVRLQGKLSRHTFPEQPNYESIAAGDAKATYFFIAPRKPICVAAGGQRDGMKPEEKRIDLIQLMLPNKAAYKTLRPHLGKEIICTGHFFHSITGHHHSAVLLDDAMCVTSTKNHKVPKNHD